MKKAVRNIVRNLCGNELFWATCPSWVRDYLYMRVQRAVALDMQFAQNCTDRFKENRVLFGPFSGLFFSQTKTQGCAIFPRLLGSYESELHNALEKLFQKSYTSIIDIGFAEGYYLVGLGKRFPQAKLIGYDISSEAHELCSKLAKENGIADALLLLLGECNIDSLAEYLPSQNLIVCDCEGFEANLFTPESEYLWIGSDLVIECHNFLAPGIEEVILSTLNKTHRVQIIPSISPQLKLSFLSDVKFNCFNSEEKLRLVDEGRPHQQSWIVAEYG